METTLNASSNGMRLAWRVAVAGMAASIVFYGAVLAIVGRHLPSALDRGRPSPRVIAAGLATLMLFAAMGWLRWRLTLDADEAQSADRLPPAERFVRRTFIALALVEVPALIGFMACLLYGGSVVDYLPFAVGPLAVIAFGILPRGTHYWAAHEARRPGPRAVG